MRSREEIEHDAYNGTLAPSPSLETNRLLYLVVELLLDIRDQQKAIELATYEVDKTVERGARFR